MKAFYREHGYSDEQIEKMLAAGDELERSPHPEPQGPREPLPYDPADEHYLKRKRGE